MIVLLCILIVSPIFAQEDEKPVYGWKNQFVGDLNFTQNTFDNWVQGGEDNVTWQLLLNAKFELNKEKYNWSNSGKIEYGRTKVGSSGSRKAADEIKLESVYTYKLNPIVNPYAAAKLQTQFDEGFNYGTELPNGKFPKTSDAFDPLYLTESIGAEYKPNENIKTFGFADDPDTNDEIEDFRNEIGAESVTELNLPLTELIIYSSKLELFSNLQAIKEVDVNWDNTFSAKLTEIIKVSLNFRVYYDNDISPRRQYKQTLALGLSYTFL